jgi:hypothetical protein
MTPKIAILLRTAARRRRIGWWRWRGIDLHSTTRLDAGVDFVRGIAQSRPVRSAPGQTAAFRKG